MELESPGNTSIDYVDLKDVIFEKKIGTGAFGEVWKANYFGTDVAVKKMLDPNDRWVSKLIEREIHALRNLRHPNICLYMGIGKQNGDVYLITEYIEGGNLRKILKNKSKSISWMTKLNYSIDIAKALTYLHAKNIIHRDLKSENMLVDKNNNLKVCDFGLCRETSNDDNPKKFMTKAGTEDWMAPEIIIGNPYNFKADIFSYGVVLYEIITRSRPPERHPMDSYSFDLEEFSKAFPNDTPPLLKELTIECIKFNSDERPTAMEILERLKKIKALYKLELKQNKAKQVSSSEISFVNNENKNQPRQLKVEIPVPPPPLIPPPPPPLISEKNSSKKFRKTSKKIRGSPLSSPELKNIEIPPPLISNEKSSTPHLLSPNKIPPNVFISPPPPLVFHDDKDMANSPTKLPEDKKKKKVKPQIQE